MTEKAVNVLLRKVSENSYALAALSDIGNVYQCDLNSKPIKNAANIPSLVFKRVPCNLSDLTLVFLK